MMTTAVQRLQPSKLIAQTQLIATDVELNSINLALKGSTSVPVTESIIDGEVTRTIEGASTVMITLFDRDRKILNSGRLAANTDIKLDGLWFRLVDFSKRGDYLTLTFEDREVAVMRTYKKHILVARKAVSRSRFIKRMVNEVKEFKIPFVCPEIDKLPAIRAINSAVAPYRPGLEGQQEYERRPGFAPWTDPSYDASAGFKGDITVNGLPAQPDQLSNTDRVLRVGADLGASWSVMVAAVETINVESSARNLHSGDRDSQGMFQQRPSQGWGTVAQVTNIEYASNSFFVRAIAIYQSSPTTPPHEIAQRVQISAFPDRYRQRREEAERTVSRWGVPLNAPSSSIAAKSTIEERRAAEAANAQGPSTADDAASMVSDTGGDGFDTLTQEAESHQFSRGIMTIIDGQPKLKPEHTWECSGRLAEEINWRRFMVSGSFYLMSEPYLFRSKPIMKINEDSPGVVSIDGEYAIGARNASANVKCQIGRWAAPPGSMVYLYQVGPLSGRWLVSEISRNLFSSEANISLKKPRPVLAEPILDQDGSLNFDINSQSNYIRPDDQPTHGVGTLATEAWTQDTEEAIATIRRLTTGGRLLFDHGNDRQGLMIGRSVYRAEDSSTVPIDPAVIQFMAWAAENFSVFRVSSLIGSHSRLVKGSNRESRHWTGHAFDIGTVGGKRVDDSSAKPAVMQFMKSIKALPLAIRPNQVICNGCGSNDPEVQALQLDNKQPKGGVWVSDHIDHVHIGF